MACTHMHKCRMHAGTACLHTYAGCICANATTRRGEMVALAMGTGRRTWRRLAGYYEMPVAGSASGLLRGTGTTAAVTCWGTGKRL